METDGLQSCQKKKIKNCQIDNFIVLPKTANVFMKVYNIYIDGTTSIFGDWLDEEQQ